MNNHQIIKNFLESKEANKVLKQRKYEYAYKYNFTTPETVEVLFKETNPLTVDDILEIHKKEIDSAMNKQYTINEIEDKMDNLVEWVEVWFYSWINHDIAVSEQKINKELQEWITKNVPNSDKVELSIVVQLLVDDEQLIYENVLEKLMSLTV